MQSFVTGYRTKYRTEPDNFSAVAYDSAILIQKLMEQYGTNRRSIEEGLGKIKNVPSVLYGRLSFNPQTRRAEGAHHIPLVVKSGSFALWDGKPASAGQR